MTSYAVRGFKDYLGCICVVFVLLLLPLTRGGVYVWSQLMAVIIVAMYCIYLLCVSNKDEYKDQAIWFLPWLAITFLIIIQLIPYKLFDLNSDQLFNQKIRITPNPAATINYWVIFTLYWVLAWIVSRLKIHQIRIIIIVIGCLLCFEAIYGFIASSNNHEKILGQWYVENYANTVSGTFVNRNNFAAIFAIGVPIVLSLILDSYSSQKNKKIRFHVILTIFFLLICMLAVISSNSRSGLICFLVSIFLWLMLNAKKLGLSNNYGRLIPITLSIFTFFLLLGLWYGLEPILNRFENVGENNRYLIWSTSFQNIPGSYWLWGAGAGSFVDNFRLISPIERSNVVYFHLHNDWLEFILDFGAIGAAIIAICMVIWFKKMKPVRLSTLNIGPICSVVAIGLFSLGDFSLRVPGVAIIFWISIGILVNRFTKTH